MSSLIWHSKNPSVYLGIVSLSMYRFQLKLPTSLRDVLEFKTSNITANHLNIGDYNILKDKIKFQKLSSDQLHLEIVLERR